MNNCNCSCHIRPYGVCIKNSHCCHNVQRMLDCEISSLKSEIVSKEKNKNSKDISDLEAKIRQLQNQIQLISEEKLRLEYELRQTENEKGKVMCQFRNENEKIKKEINEKNDLNAKLFNDNNNLFGVLEEKSKENQALKAKVCFQNGTLQELNQGKLVIEKDIYNLNNLKERHINDIRNLNNEIHNINKRNEEMNSTINSRNCMNMKIISEVNNEKNINCNLLRQLQDKEMMVNRMQQELVLTNDTLKRLEKDLNYVMGLNKQNGDEINRCNNDILKVNEMQNKLMQDNNRINNLIQMREQDIKNISNDIEVNKKCVNDLNNDINNINQLIEAYKRHIMVLVEKNEKLSLELKEIISGDDQLMGILNRVEYLKGIKEENKNIINNSLENIKTHMRNNGNKGFVVKQLSGNNSGGEGQNQGEEPFPDKGQP